MKTVFLRLQHALDVTRRADFLAPLALRLYLAPVFWMAGSQKLADMPATIEWFGNPDWGLGLPFPELLAWLAALSEAGGAVLLLCGPAALDQPAADGDHAGSDLRRALAERLAGDRRSVRAVRQHPGAGGRREAGAAREILREYGNYDWLTSSGSFAILNNGIEFAATYLVMLLALFFRRRRQVAFC